ncbi:MAG: hypothetical protein ACP5M1_10100, partial [Acidiphilium sp.]
NKTPDKQIQPGHKKLLPISLRQAARRRIAPKSLRFQNKKERKSKRSENLDSGVLVMSAARRVSVHQ